jgi:hypothetical protein
MDPVIVPRDPVIVPLSAKCFYSKMVKHCALTKINSVTVGTEWPRPRKRNICSSPKCAAGGWKLQYSLSVRLKGIMSSRRFNLIPHERPGLEPTVRIDFCESAVLNHFAIKAFCTSRNNDWIQKRKSRISFEKNQVSDRDVTRTQDHLQDTYDPKTTWENFDCVKRWRWVWNDDGEKRWFALNVRPSLFSSHF